MKFFKNQKGVTLIALTITIIVLIIITSITVVNMNTALKMKKVDKLYADISNLKTKIETYYNEYDELPTLGKYCYDKSSLIDILQNNGVTEDENKILDINDDEVYYVIDVSKLDGLTLNYGKRYANWRSNENEQDVYIINKKSHQIYYPQCVNYNNSVYYSYNISTDDVTYFTTNNINNVDFSIYIINNNNYEVFNNDKVVTESKIESNNTFYIATGGKINIPAYINFTVESGKTYKYAWTTNKDVNPAENEYKIIDTSSPISVNINSTTQNVYSVISSQLEGGNYYLFIKIIDEYGNEEQKCINNSIPIIINDNQKVIISAVYQLNKSNIAYVEIEYNDNYLSNIQYGVGTNLDTAKNNLNSLAQVTQTVKSNGNKAYNLEIETGNYIYVQAVDNYGNIASSYLYLIYTSNNID